MKLYKFRKLITQEDFYRLKNIVETGCFWFSDFWELNDPMEGIFYAQDLIDIKKVFIQKINYKICSFSGEKGFNNPAMWGYYADGFCGVAIEIEIDEALIERVSYSKIVYSVVLENDHEDEAKKVLVNKLDCWRHEDECRCLVKTDKNFNTVGEIRAIHFGSPYMNAENKNDFIGSCKRISNYHVFKNKLKLENRNNINCVDVHVVKNKVIQNLNDI